MHEESHRTRKRKIIWIVIKEIIFMACGVMCCVLPRPWSFVVLILLGAREIIRDAWRETHKMPSELSAEVPELPPIRSARKTDKPEIKENKASSAKIVKTERTKKQ